MGLDMRLEKHTYVGNEYRKPEEMLLLKKPSKPKKYDNFDAIKEERICGIVESVIYWRKANHIHNWFVKNVQDGEDNCKPYYVGTNQLEELKNICDEVLKASKLVEGKVKDGERLEGGKWVPVFVDGKRIEDSTVAEKLLPTQSGFFFGGIDYDEWYLKDVEFTRDELVKVLAETERSTADFYYQASW